MTIEKFLGLTKEEINKRKEELRRKIPTYPGTEYLKSIAKRFQVQPWPFISYLAHYSPNRLKEELESYEVYDGAENRACIIEQLKEEYILWNLISDIEKEQSSKVK